MPQPTWLTRLGRTARLAILVIAVVAGVPAWAQSRVRAGQCAGASTQSAPCLAAALTSGRLLVRGISFQTGTAVIEPSSAVTLRALAAALKMTTGTYLVESYTSSVQDAQSLSDRRAAAVRSWLLAEGVDASRLYAAGFGATSSRPPPSADPSLRDRIEISRVS
jgi:outer membrane protein OmpA-like peptidoglycan-associated protein